MITFDDEPSEFEILEYTIHGIAKDIRDISERLEYLESKMHIKEGGGELCQATA